MDILHAANIYKYTRISPLPHFINQEKLFRVNKAMLYKQARNCCQRKNSKKKSLAMTEVHKPAESLLQSYMLCILLYF